MPGSLTDSAIRSFISASNSALSNRKTVIGKGGWYVVLFSFKIQTLIVLGDTHFLPGLTVISARTQNDIVMFLRFTEVQGRQKGTMFQGRRVSREKKSEADKRRVGESDARQKRRESC